MKQRNIIPEYPSYQILKHTKCEYCPKRDSRKCVFIEHFPPVPVSEGYVKIDPAIFKDDTKRIMFVGEAPGRKEMVECRPFIGRSGLLLRRTILSLGYVRDEPPVIRLLTTNVVKCRCIGPPLMEIINSCAGALAKEADLFRPDLIIGLGKTAFHALTDLGLENILTDNRRKTFKYRGFKVRLTYHPAAALRHTSYRISLNQDLRKYLKLILDEGRQP